MYKDIEMFYKKNDPFAQFLKRLTIAYVIFFVFAIICAIYKWYIVMFAIEVVTIIVTIIHIIHFSKIMPSKIKKKVFSVHIIDNTKEMFKLSETKKFKQMVQKRKLYNKETLKCILEHYRLFISQKQFSISFVSLISIALPILLSFYNNGSFNTVDLMDSGIFTGDDTFIGGIIGMCVGILGGPIGVLLGGSYGALVGMGLDAIDTLDSASMLEQIAGKLDDGTTALIALVNEENPDAVDARFTKFDTIIARFDAAAVAQEVERAREMEAEMDRLARIELRKQTRDEYKEKIEEKKAKIKADFDKIKENLESTLGQV